MKPHHSKGFYHNRDDQPFALFQHGRGFDALRRVTPPQPLYYESEMAPKARPAELRRELFVGFDRGNDLALGRSSLGETLWGVRT